LVERVIAGEPTSDGAGVKLTRVLTQPLQRRLDPFLMLDAFGTDNPQDYIGGFPDHPHRGFETITYMIAGRMRHRDSAGHEGLLQNGGVQWMTAGRGVIHSELPEQEDGRMEGFQLWLNLAAKDKMRAPWYRDIQSAEIPELTTADGVKVRVIAGHSHGIDGAMQREVTEPLYLDLEIPAGVVFAEALPASHNAFVYVYRGELDIGGARVPVQRMAILKTNADSDGIVLRAAVPTRALLIAGKPLGEPIAQHGPFVMNTNDEIFQAVRDYQSGKFAQTP
jgi:redox-sensitive bicupin YhaK (pirin superfamily)